MVLLLASGEDLRAASAAWTGATDALWATPGNWSANPVPGTGDTATFSGAGNGNTTISLGAGVTINTLAFDTANAVAYTIGSGAAGSQTLTLETAGTISASGAVTSNQTINATLKLGATAGAGTFTIYNPAFPSSGRTLTFAGPITGGAGGTAGAKTLDLTGSSSQFVVISGAIGGGGGTLGVTVDGGTVTLSGNNTFTGPLKVFDVLAVPVFNNASSNGPLGNSATAVALSNGGILRYTGATVASTKKLDAASASYGVLEVTDANAELTLAGVVSGGGFVKDGPGALVLAAANTFGGFTVRAGSARLSGAGTFGASGNGLEVDGRLDLSGKAVAVQTLSGAASGLIVNDGTGTSTLTANYTGNFFSGGVLSTSSGTEFDGVIADNDNGGAGVVALTKNGNDSLTLTGVNTYSGLTTVASNGYLAVSGNGTLGSAAAGTTVASGSSLGLSNANVAAEPITIAGTGYTIPGYTLPYDTGALECYGGASTLSGPLTLGAAARIYVLSSGSLVINGASAITGAFTLTLEAGAGGSGTISSVIGTGAGGVTKTDAGTWTLSGVNTFTGALTVAEGVLAVPVANNASAAGPLGNRAAGVVLGATGGLTGTLAYTGASSAATTKPFTLATGGAGGFRVDNAGAALTLSGVVSGSGGLVKTGAGTLALAGANTYTGSTAVAEGTLTVPNAILANGADVLLTSGALLNLTFVGADTVGRLFIDGVLQSAGGWGGPASGAAYKTALIGGSGTLNVSGGATQPPFASFVAAQGLTGAAAAFNSDPDGDGVVNGMEFILGGNPVASSTAVQPQASANATQILLTFTRNDASEGTTTLAAQWSVDLVNWTNVPVGAGSSATGNGVTVTVTENGASPDGVVVAFPRALGSGGRLYTRLRATAP